MKKIMNEVVSVVDEMCEGIILADADLARLTGEDFGGKGGEKGVGIVEFFRFHGEAFLSCQRIDTINCHTGSARKIPRAAEQRLARTP